MLDKVRESFPYYTFRIDTNCDYLLEDLIWSVIDKYNLAMVEQPLVFDDLHCHAKLQAPITTPMVFFCIV